MIPASGPLAVVPGPGLLFGLMLLAAIVGGHASRSLHIPRVVGYLAGGVVLRLVLSAAIGADSSDVNQALDLAAEPLSAVKDLALGVVLFFLGAVFERTRLSAAWSRASRISLTDVICSVLLVSLFTCIALVFAFPNEPWAASLALALLLGVASIEIAPAATLFVLQEYESKGPITDTILVLSGLSGAATILLFYPLFFILRASGLAGADDPTQVNVLIALSLMFVGSGLIGLVLGSVLSILHARLPLAETLLTFFAVFIVLGAGEKWLMRHLGVSFNFLLTALITGATFANVALDSERLNNALRTMCAPLFAGLFVIAGYELHMQEVLTMGAVGVAYVGGRLAAKLTSGLWGVRWAGGPPRVGDALGSALLCQASIAIGLAAFVNQHWPGSYGRLFNTVVLGGVVVFELIGPLLLKRCVVQGGEVKAVTLLGRSGGSASFASALRTTLSALPRLFGIEFDSKRRSEALVARHVMRTNVQFVPAAANLDEVLGFMERTTFDHFPVVLENGDLVGMIHFSDVRDVIYDPTARLLITAYDLADSDAPIVRSDLPLDELLQVFQRYEVGVLPVTEGESGRQIVGIVDQRDVLRAVHKDQSQKP